MIELLPLLQQELKSEALIDLFETYDVQVEYEYDRTYEGMEDEYWAKIPGLGLQFVFNKNQILQTIFIYVVPGEGLEAAEVNEQEIIKFPTKESAVESAKINSTDVSEGETNIFGDQRDWVKYKYSNHSIHYEYRDSKLSLITLQVENA